MDESVVYKNLKSPKSCWYYDNQILDRVTSVSLHANTFRNTSGEWIQYVPGSEGIDKGGYSMVPLCTSILNEDFQVNIANTWSYNGGDEISGIWDTATKPVVGFANYVNDAIKVIGNNAEKWNKQNQPKDGEKKGIHNYIAEGATWIKNKRDEMGDKALDYMNARLISQGTRFTYYSGTGVSFGNLQMRFTLFPIWTDQGNFLTVPQQLEKLFPYVMGEYEPMVLDINGNEITTQELLGWQMAPAGYRAKFKDIDERGMRGTLKLRIGATYSLESLICESMSINLSKQLVKRPENVHYYGFENNKEALQREEHIFSPLYCDVVMTFSPATKYSDRAIRSFIYGDNLSKASTGENEGAGTVNRQMKDNIASIKQTLASRYPQRR